MLVLVVQNCKFLCSFTLQFLSRVKALGPSLRTSERLPEDVSEGKERPFSSP